ncbi:MAG TPA: MBOAT family protein [Verrucomicrobiae bacterium]|nr:MBOAT family protein [Verrucomicrobiae bacterium]
MLFNSPEFIFVYLPVTLVLFYVIGRYDIRYAAGFLAVASLVFYARWDYRCVPLLVCSILFNFFIGRKISNLLRVECALGARRWLVGALAGNLALLAYYKYTGFLLASINSAFGQTIPIPEVVLPLGISFFTFTQIAYLVDSYYGKVREASLLHYTLFVTYFPHLIAGPVLHHKEMMPQFGNRSVYHFDANRFTQGSLLFLLGLAKKVILADRFGQLAAAGFMGAAQGHALTLFEAWGAALCYTYQLYFDFSGYSDMAIGLGRLIGVELPINFYSPYKATNIIEFWRRWHITLSRFLRDYLYIPLGGSRKGEPRRYVNLMITMLLGGLWHGAGWTFVIWGAYHGILLALNHLWQAGKVRLGAVKLSFARYLLPFSWALTFLSVVVGWVFFRSSSFAAGLLMVKGMLGENGIALPSQIVRMFPMLGRIATSQGSVPFLGDGSVMGCFELALMISIGTVIVIACPNLYQMKRRTHFLLVALVFAFTMQKVIFSEKSEFLYFQF